jgi:hypothetical protein
LKVLELFAGSRSIGKAAEEMGLEVFSSDLIAFENINYVGDVLEFDYSKVPFVPDIIWASPPCTGFSVAALGRNWDKNGKVFTPKSDTARLGIQILTKTIEIINYYNPKYFFIENPRGMMRKVPILDQYIRHTVTYCQYGDMRMKPTDIWTNNKTWQPKLPCSNGDPCHVAAPRQSKTGTQSLANAYEKSKIPHALCLEVLESCLIKEEVKTILKNEY